jgi:3alpha(or 20beta)-hydroxysteroid dehydrogenase
MGKLTGRVAIVTGGARGIGGACAQVLCAHGASVLLTDVLQDVGEKHAVHLRGLGYQAEFLAHDVREAAQWDAAVARTLERFGRLDILVNNAGINAPETIESATAEAFRAVMEVNLIGPFLGMKAVAPAMRKSGGGSIVNISSNSTRKLVSLTTIYGASKAALAYITKTAAVHYGESRYNIRVNSVHPGPTETDMLLGGAAKAADIPVVRAMIDRIPLGRMGQPSEIGEVVAFLASDEARYVNAAEIFVDGGVVVV